MKNPEQLKGSIRNLSVEKGLNPNTLLQMCLFEGILEKLSKSKYKGNFILKGGLLISSLIGVDMRSTLDMDTTVKGIPVEKDIIEKIIKEIFLEPIDVEIEYSLEKLMPIREKDIYEDFTATILCNYGKIKGKLKIDITTGDMITPNEIEHNYSRIFGDSKISVMSYPIETILAEKFETISRRGVLSTRARDFYDIYMLYKLYKDKIKIENLSKAILNTASYRGSLEYVKDYKSVLELLERSKDMENLWNNYKNNNSFAKGIDFKDTLMIFKEIASITNQL